MGIRTDNEGHHIDFGGANVKCEAVWRRDGVIKVRTGMPLGGRTDWLPWAEQKTQVPFVEKDAEGWQEAHESFATVFNAAIQFQLGK